ncbi:MAG: aldo/keto reductase [Candidatus Pacebacteria bacterium]|nr:aldo/keto reductase [Candidatus Paceibacterota bacterium]
MTYRKLKKHGIEASIFGFGAMRMPLLPGETDSTKVDEETAIAMIRRAIDGGVNYLDTAYVYHGEYSEVVVGKALQDGYREKVTIATKLPLSKLAKPEDVEEVLDESLRRLQTDYVDFYLLHGLDMEAWKYIVEHDIMKAFEKAREKGKLKYICFSSHEIQPYFNELVDAYDWDMIQIQFNILDENYQAGLSGLKKVASRGIPLVIMEPLRGGSLVKMIPDDLKEAWAKVPSGRSVQELAFKWVTDFPEVSVVLSGVSTMEQVEDNLRIFADAEPNMMSAEDKKAIENVRDMYNAKMAVPCTACNYCMPCPSGVNIPSVFRSYNQSSMFGTNDYHVTAYNWILGSADATNCVKCGACEPKCPQRISIMDELEKAHKILVVE